MQRIAGCNVSNALILVVDDNYFKMNNVEISLIISTPTLRILFSRT